MAVVNPVPGRGEDEAFDPVSTWVGWQRYVDNASGDQSADAGGWTREQRLDHHSEFVVVRTPAMKRVSLGLQMALLVNRRHQGTARRGLIVSGLPSTGKTTTLMELGRIFELTDRRRHPGVKDRLPVAFVSVPPASTPKMLVSEFARFLGVPVLRRMNQAQITVRSARPWASCGPSWSWSTTSTCWTPAPAPAPRPPTRSSTWANVSPRRSSTPASTSTPPRCWSAPAGSSSPGASNCCATTHCPTALPSSGRRGSSWSSTWRARCGCGTTARGPWPVSPPTCTGAPAE